MLVGQWNPLSKFNNVYRMVNHLQDQVDDFNMRQEENTAGPTFVGSRFIPMQTPASGFRSGDTMSKKAQEFNDELEKLENKLATMNDVAYDRQKVDFLYSFAERSLEQMPHLELILERLQVLERIHKEAPNVHASLEFLRENNKRFPECLKVEREQIESVKKEVLSSAGKMEALFQ